MCLHHSFSFSFSFSLYLFCSFNGPTSSGPNPPLLMVVQLTGLDNFRKVASSFGAISVPLRVVLVALASIIMSLTSLLNPLP